MNTTINSSSNRHQLSVSKSGHSVRSLDVRLDFGSVMSFVTNEALGKSVEQDDTTQTLVVAKQIRSLV